MPDSNQKNEKSDTMRTIVVPALAILALLGLTWFSARVGWGSVLASYAAKTNQLVAADMAVKRNPRSAEAHYARARILEAGDLSQAVAEHREAVRARPQDYVLWLGLARAAELNGDASTAIASAQRAILLAPSYSQPHYQLGNILLRAGRTSEGFKELRTAAESDPTLMPGIIDLAWRLSKGNVQFVEQTLAPETSAARLALARYFRSHGLADEAIRIYTTSGDAGVRDRQNYVSELSRDSQFSQAAALWQVDHPGTAVPGRMDNGGFETEIDLNVKGFVWETSEKSGSVRLALDTQQPAEGRSSLKIQFNGEAGKEGPIVYQLVLVEPNRHYQLHFSWRTENIVSVALPFVSVVDLRARSRAGNSPAFARASAGWREYTIDFTTGPQTDAVQVTLERENCVTPPCPVFGLLWLDNFSLQKL
jgi:hypothetical protein